MKEIIKSIIPNFIVNKKVGQDFILTFDDGPHPEHTPKLLDILDTQNCKAIFYVQGDNAEKYPDIVREIVRRGHTIGNHTYSHCYDNEGLISYIKEINKCSVILKNILGFKPRLFRPPYGIMSIVSLLACYITGHKFMHMSLGGKEWNEFKNEDSRVISEYLVNNLKKGDVIVLHDNHPLIPSVVDDFLKKSN